MSASTEPLADALPQDPDTVDMDEAKVSGIVRPRPAAPPPRSVNSVLHLIMIGLHWQIIEFNDGKFTYRVHVPAGVSSRHAYCVVVAALMTDQDHALACLRTAFPMLSDDAAANLHGNFTRTKSSFLAKVSSAQRPSLVEKVRMVAPKAARAPPEKPAQLPATRPQLKRLLSDAEERGARKQNSAFHSVLRPFAAIMAYVHTTFFTSFFSRYSLNT